MGTLIRVQAPQTNLVEVDFAKKFLHVDTSADDDRIRALLDMAEQRLDGEDGLLGRSLLPQTWRLELPAWPATPYCLPMPPVTSVTSVQYLDSAGDLQTLPAGLYRVTGYGGDDVAIDRAISKTWPTAYAGDLPDAVRITFDAGYEDAQSPANLAVPEPIRQAAIMMAQVWYDGLSLEHIPDAVWRLINPYRVDRLGKGHG